MTQREITQPTPLLDAAGHIYRPGYAKKMLYQYDRSRIHARPFALKEWDFYQMRLGSYILQMTIGHVSYMANFSAALFSTETGKKQSFTRMRPLPLRSMNLPLVPDAPHVIAAEGRGWQMKYDAAEGLRRLTLRAEADGGVDIDITLSQNPADEKMVIATPFAKQNQFYLNCKENYYRVQGYVRFDKTIISPVEGDTAVLDWGRGVWPFHQEWFWGNGAAVLPGGNNFGFNIGWGFGDLRHASENMFFYNGKAHKLGRLQVRRDEGDYRKPWRFIDEGGQFDLTMQPVYDHETQTKLLIVNNHCHQVFGLFSGRAVLPSGEVIVVEDLPAFCEHAVNNW